MKQFVHLHTHTGYSLLDGMTNIDELVETVTKDNAPGVAITDHGTPSGVIKLMEACNKAGIKAIPGVEAYHANDITRAAKGTTATSEDKDIFHMILLAKNNTGYHNLLRITSDANIYGKSRKPRMDDAMLEKYSEGLIGTTGCLSSRVSRKLLNGEYQEALELAAIHRDILGKENYFVEIQNHMIPEQLAILDYQVRMAKDLGIGLLATNDSHYTHQHQSSAHDTLLCIGTKDTLDNPNRFKFDGDHSHYVKTAEEMYERFPEADFPHACSNTLLVNEMCDTQITLHDTNEHLLPDFDIPEEAHREIINVRLPEENDADTYLRILVEKNAPKYYGNAKSEIPDSVIERINYELDVIKDMGFATYFLILADVAQWCRDNGILMGPARGSAGGSIVSFLTRITTVDPIEHGLYFERFLNPGRKSMPDIDMDFDPTRQHEVVNYLVEKYGHERVSLVATYAYLKIKSSIKDAARAMGKPHSLSDAMCKTLDNKNMLRFRGNLADLCADNPREKISEDEDQMKIWKNSAELREIIKSNKDAEEIVKQAIEVEGTISRTGEHAAAVLLTPTALTDHVPVRAQKKLASTKPEKVSESEYKKLQVLVSEYDKDDVEAIGGLKLDLLSIMNLPAIKRAVDLVERDYNIKLDLDNLSLDDKKVYELLSEADTDGVFQLGSPGIKDLLKRMQPRTFNDISAILALYRPGPMGSDIHLKYADRLNGREKTTYFHPDAKEILSETWGQVIYQEQIMQIAQKFAGFTLPEADDLRKVMGKKKIDLLEPMEEKFVNGMVELSYKKKLADELWAMMLPFSSYAFNKAHSVGYAVVTYWTAYLKANYPEQFIAACIDFFEDDKRTAMVESARNKNIDVIAPDINKSEVFSSSSTNAVWLGMSTIKDVGEVAVNNIIHERSIRGRFTSLIDFCIRMVSHSKISQSVITSLIQVGAFDGLHDNRKEMIDNLEIILDEAKKESKKSDGTEDLDFGLFGDEETDQSTITIDIQLGEAINDYSDKEKLDQEFAKLGFFVREHPVKKLKTEGIGENQIFAEEISENTEYYIKNPQVDAVGVLLDYKLSTSKKGTQFTNFTIDSGGKRVKCVAFFPVDNNLQGEIVHVEGEVKEDTFGNQENDSTEVNIQVKKVTIFDENNTVRNKTEKKNIVTKTNVTNKTKVVARRKEIYGIIAFANDKVILKSIMKFALRTQGGNKTYLAIANNKRLGERIVQTDLTPEELSSMIKETGVVAQECSQAEWEAAMIENQGK